MTVYDIPVPGSADPPEFPFKPGQLIELCDGQDDCIGYGTSCVNGSIRGDVLFLAPKTPVVYLDVQWTYPNRDHEEYDQFIIRFLDPDGVVGYVSEYSDVHWRKARP